MLIEPAVQVNDIPDGAPADLDGGRADREKKRHSDGEVLCGLLLGEAAANGEREPLVGIQWQGHQGFRRFPPRRSMRA